MKFTAADRAAMLGATGDTAVINGTVYPCLFYAAGKTIQLFDGSVTSSGPLLVVDEDISSKISTGDTIIQIGATQYVARQALPDGAGFCELELTKDF